MGRGPVSRGDAAMQGRCFERKTRDARACAKPHIGRMEQIDSHQQEKAWAAVLARDRAADGRFVTGVLTTGIYCRPSCAARHPKRENVRFFATGAEAAAAGLRACLRCRPDEVSRDAAAVEAALRPIEAAD